MGAQLALTQETLVPRARRYDLQSQFVANLSLNFAPDVMKWRAFTPTSSYVSVSESVSRRIQPWPFLQLRRYAKSCGIDYFTLVSIEVRKIDAFLYRSQSTWARGAWWRVSTSRDLPNHPRGNRQRGGRIQPRRERYQPEHSSLS